MLSKKTKGLFVEVNGLSYLVAAATGLTPPFTLESISEFPRNDPGKLKDFIFQDTNTRRNRFFNSHCGIIPESRFFRLHSIESISRAREPDYFDDLFEKQFRINPKTSQYASINALTGEAFSPEKGLGSQKDLILCGAERREFNAFQDNLIECGIFPQSLQLSTLSGLAGLKHYLKTKDIHVPVLLVEMTTNSANFFIVSSEKVDLCRPISYGFNAVLPVIQQELGLKDEESARSLFFSNTFDFREIGAKLLRKILKELNSSTGFYEVQTGQTIPYLYMMSMPENLGWIPEVIAAEMDIDLLDIDWGGWAHSIGVEFGDECSAADLGPSRFGLFSLFLNFESGKDGHRQEK